MPTTVVAGYTSGATPDKVSLAVEKGMNVMFWSFIELKDNEVVTGLTADYIGSVMQALPNGTDLIHFASIGGWSAPHDIAGTCGAVACSGVEYAKSFRAFNERMKADVSGFPGFDGIDWDYEGADDQSLPTNNFTLEVYELMLNMTQELKSDFLISMVPAQSYFNCEDPGFNSSLLFPAESNPSFTYAGKNAYTVLYAKCPDCFDLIMVQLYEGYSLAGFDLYWGGNESNVGAPGWPQEGTQEDMQRIVSQNMQCLVSGWEVAFNGYWGVKSQKVTLPASKVVMGLGNGWTHSGDTPYKFPFFNGTACGAAWCDGVTSANGAEHVRGFAYWDISDDDNTSSFVSDIHVSMNSCQGLLTVAV